MLSPCKWLLETPEGNFENNRTIKFCERGFLGSKVERKDSELASAFSLKDFKIVVSATWNSYLKKHN
jgi:hypothetical protein